MNEMNENQKQLMYQQRVKKEKLWKKRTKMKNVTIALPEIYVRNIEKLQKIGMTPSRSEAIRTALREFLKKETEHTCKLLEYI